MLQECRQHTEESAKLDIPPLPLNAQQTSQLSELLQNSRQKGKQKPSCSCSGT
ncbi:hypothetical protein [Planktothricoides raciborskii]|uniref:Aconitase B HEAT-like domain-containing protein n=1 Tax=Planktothricoides raciborskii GIHE-MW2 TaxID=2792601 RepID=A0AAU8JNA8_9CYAN|nr:hypothetical protein [Planktothricoides raciborskii]